MKNKETKEEYAISFYDIDEKEISRKVYRGSYGSMINNANKRAKRIGATHFWHKQYIRRFEVELD